MGLEKAYRGRRVLVTGHTGFKGSWLSIWLYKLGAEVLGVSRDVPTDPSHFLVANLSDILTDRRIEIRHGEEVQGVIKEFKPNFIFHLAAQALVRRSYARPIETWETNVLGTLNVLDALRGLDHPCTAVIITSDKCYENVEWLWGYRENDTLGGVDPYSASKGAAELAIRSYVKSFFPPGDTEHRIASARAGNVIGGGDWALDRIVPDCVRAWSQGEAVDLRHPHATRPWQHVLEPLSGYLVLAAALTKRSELHGEPFNFGPSSQQSRSVLELVQQMAEHWEQVRWRTPVAPGETFYESSLLKLNCDKASHHLDWRSVMSFDQTVRFTADWYRTFYSDSDEILRISLKQIDTYMDLAAQKEFSWVK